MTGGHRLAGPVSWSVVGLMVGLAIFYGWRTAANREELTRRNLRELDRIGRTIEGRADGFAAGMVGWYTARSARGAGGAVPFRELVPDLLGEPTKCRSGESRAQMSGQGARFCYGFTANSASGGPGVEWWGGDFSVERFRQALTTDFFDAAFLVSDSGRVLLSSGLPGLRLNDLPPDTARGGAGRISTVRDVAIAGREYRLFLQPVDVRGVAGEPAGLVPVRWSVGGLVSVARFRAESLALDPPHLIFLGLLLVLAVLSLPYLRAALMDRWESIKVADVYLLSVSVVIATGIFGIGLADIAHFGSFSKSLDHNLAASSARIAGAFQREVEQAVRELDEWRPQEDPANSRVRIWAANPPAPDSARYFRFQMLIWIRPDGMQADKLTPRERNTPLINVADRAYFRRIKEQKWYELAAGPGATEPLRYYVESIRSKNTGEKLAVISAPYCWEAGKRGPACPPDSQGVVTTSTRLASLDSPLLPPGFQFAVVQRDGLALFHSDPERNLDENVLSETGDDPDLRALLAARDSGGLRATYMGHRSRLYVRPLAGTDSLSLVVMLDESLPGTAHFESIFLSLAAFFGWALVLWLAFMVVELIVPRRLQWAWPDRNRPSKYPLLTGLLSGFGALLVAPALLALRYQLPLDPASFLVPIQAISVALLVLSAGISERHLFWRHPRLIGWVVLGLATVLQLALHLQSTAPRSYLLLWAGQLAMVALAIFFIRRLDRGPAQEPPSETLETWYVATIVVTLAVTALLPAYLFQQEAVIRQRNRLLHYEQVHLREGLAAREDLIRVSNRQLQLEPPFDSLLSKDSLDLAAPPVLGGRTDGAAAQGCRARPSSLGASVFARLERYMPFVTSEAVELRRLGGSDLRAGLEICRGGVLQLAGPDPPARDLPPAVAERFRRSQLPTFGGAGWWRLLLLLGILTAGYALASTLCRWLGRRIFLLDLPAAAPLDLAEQLPLGAWPGRTGPTRLIAIGNRPLQDRDAFRAHADRIHYLDLVELAGSGNDLGDTLNDVPANKLLVLDHFDHRLHDREWGDRLLLALETQVWLRTRNVVLMTSREPRALFPLAEQVSGPSDESTERWVRLLGQFVEVEVADADTLAADGLETSLATTESEQADATTRAGTTAVNRPAPAAALVGASGARGLRALVRALVRMRPHTVVTAPPASRSERVLQRECAADRGLAEIAVRLRSRPDFGRLTPNAVVEQVREMAETYYHALWAELERHEKLVVSQLARGVVVNPNGKRAVRRLLARGVAVRQPELRLMNESFRRFILEEVPASIEEREFGAPSSAWQSIRFPIGLAVIIVAGFLFVTQRGTFDSAIAVVTAAGVGSTAILKLIGTMRLPGRASD